MKLLKHIATNVFFALVICMGFIAACAWLFMMPMLWCGPQFTWPSFIGVILWVSFNIGAFMGVAEWSESR